MNDLGVGATSLLSHFTATATSVHMSRSNVISPFLVHGFCKPCSVCILHATSMSFEAVSQCFVSDEVNSQLLTPFRTILEEWLVGMPSL